jgi:HAD superfamily hydrolase (TIGR01509 family)
MSIENAALLFDLDGTLTDTDSLHFEAYRRLLAPHAIAITHADYKSRIMGATNAAIMSWLFPDRPVAEHVALADEKERLFRAMAGDMTRTPGLSALLDWAAAHAVKTAVVTNAPRANAEMMLAALGLDARFPVLVIGDELARGKPDPLPYATALARLGARAETALAFEDSRSGIAAARGAGLFTFGLTTGLDADSLHAAGANAAIRDFADPLLLESLRSRFGSAPAQAVA